MKKFFNSEKYLHLTYLIAPLGERIILEYLSICENTLFALNSGSSWARAYEPLYDIPIKL